MLLMQLRRGKYMQILEAYIMLLSIISKKLDCNSVFSRRNPYSS